MILIVSLIFVILFSSIFPAFVYTRIKYTFQKQSSKQVSILGKSVALDQSAAARIYTVRESIEKWSEAPIIGHGAGSAGAVVDNNFSRLLIEIGILGLIVFIFLAKKIFSVAIKNLRVLRNDNFSNGLISGFIAGFIGLLIHSLGAATFILVRIMEPFWFLTAIIVMLPDVVEDNKELTRSA